MFRLTIQRRAFLAVFALAAALIVLLSALILVPLRQDFGRFAAEMELVRVEWLAERLESVYDRDGNWQVFRRDPEAWRRMSRPPAGPPGGAFPPGPMIAAPPPGGGVRDPLQIHPRLALRGLGGDVLAGNPDTDRPAVARMLRWQGRDIGKLTLLVPATPARAEAGAFLASQSRHLALAGIAALLLSLAAAWWLTRHFAAPIRQLTEAARRIAGGELSHRVDEHRSDELGALAADFNVMAASLAELETSRQRWISDTSHELRTPIAVLRAEIEALQDGVRQADDKTLDRLHQQIDRLGKLVDDLRQTTDFAPAAADTVFDPLALLNDAVDDFRERYAAAGLAVEAHGLAPNRCFVRGDAGRLYQVFANLLENTLRYTAGGGRLRIEAAEGTGRLVLCFDDTAPAPPPAALPRLFDRFYRAEASRSRAHGGSGLGLAICKTIVESQGGTIDADLSKLGGLSVRLTLPQAR